jgi:RNA polymerase sigma factor (sigma-70 family)
MNLKNLSNTELIKRCAQDSSDQSAWTEFYTRFDEHIRLMLVRECRRKHLNANNILEDLVQDVYMRLVQKKCKALWDYKAANDDSIYSYLAVIAHSVVCGYLAREGAQKRRHHESSLDAPAVSSSADDDLRLIDTIRNDEPDPDANLIRESERQEIEYQLDKVLTKNTRERDKLIFKLYFNEGFSPVQIAAQCGALLSEKRIGNIITELKKRLAEQLRGG